MCILKQKSILHAITKVAAVHSKLLRNLSDHFFSLCAHALKLPQPGPQNTSHHSQALPVPVLIPITLPENWRRKVKESQINRVSEGIFLALASSEAEFQLRQGPPPNICDQVLSISLSGFCDRPSRSAGRIKGLILPAPKSSASRQYLNYTEQPFPYSHSIPRAVYIPLAAEARA